tara:strand:+ start:40 stop:441 length:402 start_codon:yes stop_codon:yes gene_type:complete
VSKSEFALSAITLNKKRINRAQPTFLLSTLIPIQNFFLSKPNIAEQYKNWPDFGTEFFGNNILKIDLPTKSRQTKKSKCYNTLTRFTWTKKAPNMGFGASIQNKEKSMLEPELIFAFAALVGAIAKLIHVLKS